MRSALPVALFLIAAHAASTCFSQETGRVGDHSPVFYNQGVVSPEQMQQMNADHHRMMQDRDPDYDSKREAFEQQVQALVNARKQEPNPQSTITIPVVVHLVYKTTTQNISDAQILSQIQVLNEDFGRTNPDTVDTPGAFLPVAANTGIQFCMAQRDPNGFPTTGIERRQTYMNSFIMNDAMKFYAQGGLDIWDPTRYMNIWICNMGSTGILGYGEFPTGNTTPTFGVVIHYSVFGDTLNVLPGYDGGRTTTHEIGHCFNLFHIWGDDGTACTGTDYCGDTPNQGGPTNGCFTFPHTDNCTTTGNGIMFENFMDYTIDSCKNLFTVGQSSRMNAVLSIPPYSGLVTSNACQPFTLLSDDAGMRKITAPTGTVCTTFTPSVVLLNWGSDTLTSCILNYQVDAQVPSTFSWSGSLAPLDTETVALPPVTATGGNHTFTVYTTFPNGNTDAQPVNDTLAGTFTVIGTGSPLPYAQGFESGIFPPAGWVINNPDADTTWRRTTTSFSQTGTASAMVNNLGYVNGTGEKDELILQTPLNLSSVSTPVLTFDVAYTYYNQTFPTAQLYTDTLSIFISTNCGSTWTQVYKKGGAQLATMTPVPNGPLFVPGQSHWQFKTVSLGSFQSSTKAIFMFRNTCDWGNALYLDNINIVNATGVEEQDLGSMVNVYPNPTGGLIHVDLDMLQGDVQLYVYNLLGREVAREQVRSGQPGITLDLSGEASGVYFVKIITASGSAVKKIVLDKK
jgi:hypothetical protein